MDLRQLEIFLAVVDYSGVTNAARRLNVTPGAVSLHLQNLASELKTDLFRRTGKRLEPTPDALRLAAHARELLRRAEQIRLDFDPNPAADTRPFRFATGATALIYRLRRPLRALRQKFQRTQFRITVAPTEAMVAGLLERRFDLALITMPYAHEGLTITPLFEEELLVLRPSPKPQKGWRVGTLTPDEIAAEPFLLYPRSSNMRSIIDAFFKEIGIAPQVPMEADDTEAIRSLVEAGFGHSVLPEFALRRSPRFFQPYRVAGYRAVRQQVLASAATSHPRALTREVAAFLQQSLTSVR